MPRDGSGIYSLPAGNPVVTNTVIASSWANTTMSDIAAQLNNVFTRDGLLGPTGPFKIMDGTAAAPGLAFNSEPGLGWFRQGTSIMSWAAQGSKVLDLNASGAGTTVASVFPRAANGESDFIAYNQPSGTANINRVQLGINSAGAYLYSSGLGTFTKLPMTFDAAAYNFTGGSATFAANVVANGLFLTNNVGLTQDASAVYFTQIPNWVWVFSKANGALQWQHGAGALQTYLQPNGDFIAGRDVYTGTGNGAGSIAMINGNGVTPYLRFSPDGWKWIYSAGSIFWQNPSGTSLWGVSAAGDMTSLGKWVTSGAIGLQFSTASQNTQYVAIGNAGGGSYEIAFNLTPASWAGIRMIAGSGQFQFPTDGLGRATVAGPWGALISDERVKERIEDYTDGLDAILALRPRVFSFRPETGLDSDKRHISLIAQEAEQAMPILVTPGLTKQGTLEYEDMKGLDIGPVTWALVNAVKTLHQRLRAVEVIQ